MSTITNAAGTALIAAALSLTGFVAPATAAAATDHKTDASADATFLWIVDELGIKVDNKHRVIGRGHNVCAALDDKTDPDDIVATLTKENQLTTKQARSFVVVSVRAYCPEHL